MAQQKAWLATLSQAERHAYNAALFVVQVDTELQDSQCGNFFPFVDYDYSELVKCVFDEIAKRHKIELIYLDGCQNCKISK
mgnify:CR=1 FL=1